MDIRLKTAPLSLRGREWTLRCNNNVLADVQEMHGGNLIEALDRVNGLRACCEFLAAMLNDCADTNGWPERFTPRQIGRELSFRQLQEIGPTVMGLVYDAVAEEPTAPAEDEEPSKN